LEIHFFRPSVTQTSIFEAFFGQKVIFFFTRKGCQKNQTNLNSYFSSELKTKKIIFEKYLDFTIFSCYIFIRLQDVGLVLSR